MKELLKKKIIDHYDDYSTTELKVAKYVVDHYDDIWTYSSGELAKAVGVSDATVVRFAKSLGYKGFLQLRGELKSEGSTCRSPYYIAKSMSETLDDKVLSDYASSLEMDMKAMFANLDMDQLTTLAKDILEADTVYLFGVGSERAVCEYLASYFPLIGVKVCAVESEGLAMREAFISLTERDLVIMSSFPSIQADEFWLVKYIKETGAKLFLMTDSELTAKGLDADNFVLTGSNANVFFSSTVLTLCFCDILLLKLREIGRKRADAYLYKYEVIRGAE